MFAADGSLREGVDLAPLTVSTHTRLARVVFLVTHLGGSSIFVVDEGRLAGLLTRLGLFRIAQELHEELDERGAPLRVASDGVAGRRSS